MDSFNTLVDFAGLIIIDDDGTPVPVLTGSCSAFALAAIGMSAGMFLSPSLLVSGSTGVKLGSTMGLVYVRTNVDLCSATIHNLDRQGFCCKIL
jgi:hypothetical protein